MSKEKYKIYELDYLSNEELTEEDLHYLFDTDSLIYSLIINMFHFAGITDINNDNIISMCKGDSNWMRKNKWTKKKFSLFNKKLEEVYKNIYQYNSYIAKQNADWFMIQYALSVK